MLLRWAGEPLRPRYRVSSVTTKKGFEQWAGVEAADETGGAAFGVKRFAHGPAQAVDVEAIAVLAAGAQVNERYIQVVVPGFDRVVLAGDVAGGGLGYHMGGGNGPVMAFPGDDEGAAGAVRRSDFDAGVNMRFVAGGRGSAE